MVDTDNATTTYSVDTTTSTVEVWTNGTWSVWSVGVETKEEPKEE